jgi:predicted dehydrogenase
MFAEPDIDLVSVVVKAPSHREVVVAALNAGKNVYCEWPLGANLSEAEEMAALAARKGVRAMIGLQARGDPALRYLRELVADDYLGEVLAVNMTMFTGGVLDRPKSRLWDRDKTKGISALTVRGIHTMDVLCWCLGDFVELSGKVTTQVRQWRVIETNEMVDVDTADNVMVQGRLQSGAIVRASAPCLDASGWRMEIYGRKEHDPRTTLLGAQKGGRWSWPFRSGSSRFRRAGRAAAPGHLYLRMARAIRSGGAVEPISA